MTGGRQAFWTIDTKLRTRGVQFVSAGLHSTTEEKQKPEENRDAPSQLHTPQDAVPQGSINEVDRGEETSWRSATILKPAAHTSDPDVQPEKQHQIHTDLLSTSSDQLSPSPRVGTPDLFFVDTTGDTQAVPQTQRPQIRSLSPTKSDSSDDEVIFHGRSSQPRVVEDPVVKQQHQQVIKVLTASQVTSSEQSWDDTSVEWVHRSKPGIGWAVPRARKKAAEQPPLLTFPIQKEQTEDTSAVDDYLKNVQEHDPDFLHSATFVQRDLDIDLAYGGHVHQQFQSLSVSGVNTKDGSKSTAAQTFHDNYVGSDSGDEIAEFGELSNSESSSSDEDNVDADDSEDEEDNPTECIDDESLAILLSKQEELGLGSDKLILYDEGVDATVARTALRYAKETPKKSRREKGSFPSATLMVDVLKQDPYGGFDIMDFDRPSLRKRKGKGKSTKSDLSDSGLGESMQPVWQGDRKKKAEQKQEREELRAQGLLGRKSVNSKYGEGMTIWQIGKEFESFLASEEREKALPPMDKKRRKMVHEIATEFNVKTKSTGKGTARYTKLIKIKMTTQYTEARFAARARRVNMGFFPRINVGGIGKPTSKVSTGGGNSHAVRYQDGDIVGGTAPEIGAENRGRAMLEKMGWSSGMALGTHDNKGILEPIAHIVKNTKSGLG
jgi:hypothetical protein